MLEGSCGVNIMLERGEWCKYEGPAMKLPGLFGACGVAARGVRCREKGVCGVTVGGF